MAARDPQSAPLETSVGETRERLLDAAEKLFGRRGFRDTTVRDLIAEAGTNVAAVNYHFGNKENLYREMMLRRLRQLREQRVAAIERVVAGSQPTPTAEELVRAFTTATLAGMTRDGDSQVLLELFYREMVEHRLPVDLVESEMLPVIDAFVQALRFVAPGLDETSASLCFHSLEGQITELLHARSSDRTLVERHLEGKALAEAIEHVVRFTTAGIRASAASAGGRDAGSATGRGH